MYQILIRFLEFFFKTIQIVFKSKNDLLLENMASGKKNKIGIKLLMEGLCKEFCIKFLSVTLR